MTPSLTVLCCESRYVDTKAAWVTRAALIAEAAACVTHAQNCQVEAPPEVRDRRSYSQWLIAHAADVTTTHMLIVQSDGRIINPHLWDSSWLDYDYIGAPWPQWIVPPDKQHRRVGNGGFSLRSTALMRRVRELGDGGHEEEDVRICQELGDQLEAEGFRFAPMSEAMRFSFEQPIEDHPNHWPALSFGLHRSELC